VGGEFLLEFTRKSETKPIAGEGKNKERRDAERERKEETRQGEGERKEERRNLWTFSTKSARG